MFKKLFSKPKKQDELPKFSKPSSSTGKPTASQATPNELWPRKTIK